MTSRRPALRRSFVATASAAATATVVVAVAGLGCGGSVDGGGPLPTSCPSDKPAQGTPCAVERSTVCSSGCASTGAAWASQCIDGAWKDGFQSCNPPGAPQDTGVADGVADATPDAPTTCPDSKPVEGSACAVEPGVFCHAPCDATHVSSPYWGASCVDHHWATLEGSCNPPPPPSDTGVVDATLPDAGGGATDSSGGGEAAPGG